MKKNAIVIIFVVWLLSACSSHYYQRNEDTISFFLKNNAAKDVHFQYSHDGFSCHEAEKIDRGIWRVRVPAIREFSYFYVVDGKVYTPPCEYMEKDDFGSENCIFTEGL